MKHKHTQNGNVLFIVLAGIALFAALSVAVTRSGNTDGAAVMSQSEAKLHAASIMAFGNDVEQGVARLLTLRGCDITEVSFERSPFDGSDTDYVNSNSPSDLSCHVFHPSGGQVEYMTFEDKWKDEDFSASTLYGDWYVSVMCFGAGSNPNCNTTSETERRGSLVLYAPLINLQVCQSINNALLRRDDVYVDQNALVRDDEPFVGDFAIDVPHFNIAAPNHVYNNIFSMCAQTSSTPAANGYTFYNTLFLREDRFQ